MRGRSALGWFIIAAALAGLVAGALAFLSMRFA
jgi:hypothetical protein